MGTESLRNLADIFSRRFFLNALLPTLVFTSVGAAVVVSTVLGTTATSAWWRSIDVFTRIIVVLAYLAAVYFLAAAVASQWRGIVRLFEGYPLRWLPRLGTRWHQEQFDKIYGSGPPHARRLSWDMQAYYRYPGQKHRERILPTRLGNILLSGERYAYDRYGIDTIVFWPRLHPLLPETFQREYEGFVINYEFPLVVSFQSMLTGTVCATAILVTNGSPVAFAVTFLGGLLLSYAAYCLGLSNAEDLAEQQRAAFDLYRNLLLEAWPTVRDVADEKEAFEIIRAFVYEDGPAIWQRPQARHARRRIREQRTDSS